MKENFFIKDKLKKLAIEKYLSQKLKSAGFIDIDILKSPFSTKVVIYSLKPGFIIGKKGANIRLLTTELEEKFGLSKVHIEIGEIPNKDLDPKVVMENISVNIGKGTPWKSVVVNALKGIREAGAIGAEIIAKGNTSGKGQRKRKSRFFFGYMKKAGEQKNFVAYQKRTTFPSLGTIGIKLRIVKPDVVFSDKVDVENFAKKFKIQMEEEELETRKQIQNAGNVEVIKNISEKVVVKKDVEDDEESLKVLEEKIIIKKEKKPKVKLQEDTVKDKEKKTSKKEKKEVIEKQDSIEDQRQE